jgi:hypothetical protein
MNLKFRHKVFLTLLLNGLLIVICSLLIARYFAFLDFESYIDKMEMERLSELADLLSQEYQKNGSWLSILDDPGHWHAITRIGRRHRPEQMATGFPSFVPAPVRPRSKEGRTAPT